MHCVLLIPSVYVKLKIRSALLNRNKIMKKSAAFFMLSKKKKKKKKCLEKGTNRYWSCSPQFASNYIVFIFEGK